jgi:hypothetical protein
MAFDATTRNSKILTIYEILTFSFTLLPIATTIFFWAQAGHHRAKIDPMKREF